MLAIVAPMPTELAGIRRAVRDPQSRGIYFSVTGIGKAAITAGFARAAKTRPEAVILAGFSGAVAPELQTGDLHIAASFHACGEYGPITADTGLSSAMREGARLNDIRVCIQPSGTVSGVANAAVKAELRFAAGVASVNMEDYWAATAAAIAGVPFASVRAVLDTSDQSLPDYLASGDIAPARVALNALVRPGRLPALLRLARQSRLARRNLTRCIMATIDILAARQPVPTGAPR